MHDLMNEFYCTQTKLQIKKLHLPTPYPTTEYAQIYFMQIYYMQPKKKPAIHNLSYSIVNYHIAGNFQGF